MTSAGMFAVPTAGAAAAVVAPGTEGAALSAAEVVPAVPVVAVVPVRLLTLAAPDVSVLAPAVFPLVVFPLVSTEPVAADVPVEPVTDDGQEAAPSVTPEVVETLPPEVPAELLSVELLSVELPDVELPDESSELPESELPESELPESELPESELPESELSSESLELEPLEPESLSESSSSASSWPERPLEPLVLSSDEPPEVDEVDALPDADPPAGLVDGDTGPMNRPSTPSCRSGVQLREPLRISADSWEQETVSIVLGVAAIATPCGRKAAAPMTTVTAAGRQIL